jgi:hypothetical protein
VKRKVAVKLIKVGMDSRAVLARFEAERQALAVMDHPNIAKVLDGGPYESRPFFVMELVKGIPITEFCDARKLTPKERLELFLPVCQAIQHAHMKGIIHRDIKPSNVLVALYDDRAVPKVIDFGVAKATGQTLTDLTRHTGFGAVVGTPEYMSPEQASFNNLDIDTRSDVYSLGVLMYELLTGTTPVDRKSLKEAALLEVLRIVREVEAPRPSQKLSTAATLASIAANRGMEPANLPKLMQGELDWIVLKSLDKDRSRRYESANSLAADVGRYLSGKAVSACPPTLGYRLKKAYRRNRAAVLVGLAFALMLLTGVAVASVLAIQARRAEALAESKRLEAEVQTTKAELIAADYGKLSSVYMDAAEEAEIRSNSARIDADLLEYKADARVGLLRLARPLKDSFGPLQIDFPSGTEKHSRSFENDPEFIKLREFQTAAVIAAGQEFVPLVPPIDDDDKEDAIYPTSSPDGRFCIVGNERFGLKLMAIPSLTRIGVLREGTERLVKWGFSLDGQTIWTQDTDSIVRFWNTDGTYRTRTPMRPARFVYPAGMTVKEVSKVADRANPVLVANGVAVVWSQRPVRKEAGTKPDDWNGLQQPAGPTDLYSTSTGQFIRALDRQDWSLSDFQLAASGRWVIYYDQRRDPAEPGEIDPVIVSTADGSELARLKHPGEGQSCRVRVSPTGKWVLTGWVNADDPRGSYHFRLWSSSNWKTVDDVALEGLVRLKIDGEFPSFPDFITDDVLDASVLKPNAIDETELGVFRLGQAFSLVPPDTLGYSGYEWPVAVSELGGSLIRCGRVLTDANTFQRLKPPLGRKYAPELAKLAPDGRFFENLDTVTEKELPCSQDGHYWPGYGRVSLRYVKYIKSDGLGDEREEPYLHILPDSKRLDIPPEMLELWVQVVTGGELGSDGRFEAWDEPTWAAKQKQLAAMPPPYADFPFPGWAATEPNLWYRIQANRSTGKEREKLIDEWRRRSGRVRPKPEPDTWRTLGTVLELAPPPRAVK